MTNCFGSYRLETVETRKSWSGFWMRCWTALPMATMHFTIEGWARVLTVSKGTIYKAILTNAKPCWKKF